MYKGSLNIEKMNPVQKKAYKSWKDQGQRCQNPKNPRYEFYGKKGVQRIYGAREFISWFEQEYSKKENWTCAQVDRINSNGNYDFSNIRLIERSENVSFRNEEHGNPTDSEMVEIIYPDGTSKVFDSIREAARLTGLSRYTIQVRLRNELKRKGNADLIIKRYDNKGERNVFS